jgi:drug/metabolite transporter (DMT)-like permease
MIECWGYFSGNSIMYLISGTVGLFLHVTLTKKYTILNYNTFLIYSLLNINYVCLSLAFAFAKVGSELLQITIVDYLWTITTYLMLIYFLDYKIANRFLFVIAILCAFVGICITCIGFKFSYLSDFFVNLQNDWYAYLFALGVVFSWSLYSVFIKKYSEDVQDDHIYVSFIISGLFFLLLSFVFTKYDDWSNMEIGYVSILVMIYESLIATLLPYYLWNIGYKHGDELLISRFSLLSPILNVSFTSVFYGLSPYVNIFVGAFLLIVSAYLCKKSVEIPVETHNIIDENRDIENNKDIEIRN